jgi:hypothetical protein
MSIQKERRIGLLLIGSVIAVIILASMLGACSAVKHVVPDHGSYYVTKRDTCSRQNVSIELKQDLFASKISLKYMDQQDTITVLKAFRRQDANTYTYLTDSVVIGKGQILHVNGITVDYRCH